MTDLEPAPGNRVRFTVTRPCCGIQAEAYFQFALSASVGEVLRALDAQVPGWKILAVERV